MSTFTKGKRCYDCVFRKELSWTHHSQCCNPAMLDDSMKVLANPHGIKNGWCAWPFNFDPVWINDCTHHSSDPEDVKEELKDPIELLVGCFVIPIKMKSQKAKDDEKEERKD